MTRRHFVDNAPTPTFGPIGTSDTGWNLSSAAGLPAVPFTATLDLGTVAQENILVNTLVGVAVTVTRNIDGLGAFSHGANATFNHTALAQDYDEANAHVNASVGVHGIGGAVVGTTDTQTLSNKTFSGLALTANSGVTGVTVTGDNTGDLQVMKNGATTVAKFDKDGKLTAAQVTTAGTLAAGPTSITGALSVSTNETVAGTLGVVGQSNLGAVVAGATSVSTLATSGAATLASAVVSGTASVSGTLTAATVNATKVNGRINPPQYTNEAARDAAIPSPAAGELCTLTSPTTGQVGLARTEFYSGGVWKPLPAAQPGTSSIFTSSGTWTKPTGLLYAKVRGVAAGGASGSVGGTSGAAAPGGGGAGGYFEKIIAASSLGATETVTVGAAGAAAASGNNNGGAGGTTSFGAFCTATGGSGGLFMTLGTANNASLGGSGGGATGGDINITGQAGAVGIILSPGTGIFVNGGGSPGGGLGVGGSPSSTAPTGYGSGAGGVNATSAGAGIAGAPGVVIVEHFF